MLLSGQKACEQANCPFVVQMISPDCFQKSALVLFLWWRCRLPESEYKEQDTTARALNTAKSMLQDYQQPDLDPGINEALLEYIVRREREIPAMDALNQDS